MKKIVRIFISLTLSLSLLFICDVNAMGNQSVPSIIIECIDGIYNNNNIKYSILDEDEKNVEDIFKQENELRYKQKDYEGIYDYISNNEIVFEIKNNDTLLRASKTYSLTKVFVHTYQFDSEKKFTFGVECYGVVRVNENNGVITSYSGPSVSLYQPSGGGAVSETLASVSTNVSMGSTNRSIVFTYKYAYSVNNNIIRILLNLVKNY